MIIQYSIANGIVNHSMAQYSTVYYSIQCHNPDFLGFEKARNINCL